MPQDTSVKSTSRDFRAQIYDPKEKQKIFKADWKKQIMYKEVTR